jgi:hypothetical protein
LDNTTIANVTVAGTVSNTGGDYTGGIAGRAINNSTLTGVTSSVTVTGIAKHYVENRTIRAGVHSIEGGNNVGGIVGLLDNSTLTNATGTVDGVKATYKWNRPWPLKDKTYKGGGQNIGSIVGLTTGTSTIK